MNTNFLHKSIFSLLGLASLAVITNESSALAGTVNKTNNQVDLEISSPREELNRDNTQLKISKPEILDSRPEVISVSQISLKPSSKQAFLKAQQISKKMFLQSNPSGAIPIPGTVATSSAALNPEVLQQNNRKSVRNSDKNLAQADIGIGKTTRGGSSYIGIGANIGLDGTSALGDGNFAVISKVGLTKKISLRPSAVLGDDTVFLIPLTYDFSLNAADPFTEPLPIAPYIGAGAAIETGDDSETAFLVTGGIDVPLNSQFTANAAVNAAFFDDTDIGLMLGVGYNFSGF